MMSLLGMPKTPMSLSTLIPQCLPLRAIQIASQAGEAAEHQKIYIALKGRG